MAHVAASGRHGRGMGRRRKATGLWGIDGVIELVASVLAMSVVASLPISRWFIVWTGSIIAGHFIHRLSFHRGDRHRRIVTAAEEAAFDAERTPIDGVPLPASVIATKSGYDLPPYNPPAATTLPDVVKPSLSPRDRAKIASLVIAFVVTVLAKASNHRLDNARQMQDDIESLLGIPGRWNNYGRNDTS